MGYGMRFSGSRRSDRICYRKEKRKESMIIDIHTHAFDAKVAERAVSGIEEESGITPYTRGTPEQLIRRMDEWGVDMAAVLPIATKPSQQKTINDWAAALAEREPRLIMFGTVHPDAEDCIEEVGRIKSLGLKGIKLHPDYQNFMADDPKLDSLYTAIAKSGLPMLIHAGWDCHSPELVHCPPVRALRMIERHRDLKVILAHLGGNDRWEQVLELIAGHDGEVYLDTAFTAKCPDKLMAEIIRTHGSDRVMLGSDCPWESTQKIIEKIMRLPLSTREREEILGANAQRLFGL